MPPSALPTTGGTAILTRRAYFGPDAA